MQHLLRQSSNRDAHSDLRVCRTTLYITTTTMPDEASKAPQIPNAVSNDA